MAYYFGIDTSNYTTSAAIYDTDTRAVTQVKKLLTVRPGERGLRQLRLGEAVGDAMGLAAQRRQLLA